MNIMKLVDIKSTILIILVMCMCFFIQTYYEIENMTNIKTTVDNTVDITKLSGTLDNKITIDEIDKLKKDLKELKTTLNDKYNSLEKTLNEKIDTNTTRLDEAKIKLKTLLTPTDSGS
jgi:protein subunit release factor A